MMAEIDLTTCESEPIHIPGLVQPHGVLLVLRKSDLLIVQTSVNTSAVLGIPPERLLGRSVDVVFDEGEPIAVYRNALATELHEGKPVYLFTVRAGRHRGVFDTIAHRSGDYVLFELEPVEANRFVSVPELYRQVQNAIVGVREAVHLDELYRVCALHIRRITGFDRVMVYRFDAEWNGEVVAEEKREDLEPFLGLHYPASDIPKQARELYTRNWLRFIPDRDYQPAGIATLPDEAGKPLDMTYSVLRSVSPVHIQYLRNMGVGASMSVSIIKQGKLWGLIACHHYSPRRVPYDVRTACELLAQVMSSHLAAAEDRVLAEYAERLRHVQDELAGNLDQLEDLDKALVIGNPNLLDFIQAGGAAVVDGDEVYRVGQTPGESVILQLAQKLHPYDFEEVFASDKLQPFFSEGHLGNVAAGFLALRLSRMSVRQLIWFRPEQVRTVHWAGDPAKSVAKGDTPDRLSPRGSFALWKQTVRGRSEPWSDAEIYAAKIFRQSLMALMIARAERRAADTKDLRLASVEREKLLESERATRVEAERLNRIKDEFVATLSHELRTPLNAILGWAQIVRRGPGLSPDVGEAIDIIERNARAQSQMIEDLLEMSRIINGKLRLDLQDTHFPTIVRSAIETVRIAADAKNVRLEELIDPLNDVQTTGDPSRLQQVVWNLLSNAVKFTPKGGKVQVILERVNSHVELTIADTGIGIPREFLPHVFDRFRQADASSNRKFGGLGLGLSIVRNLVELHGGTVRAESRGEGQGATFVVSLPTRVMNVEVGSRRVHPHSQQRPTDCESLRLGGVRVLVVDDEADARNLIERLLVECECVVTKAASSQEAMEHLKSSQFDVLVSDIGMPEQDGFTLIRQLRQVEELQSLPRLPAVALTAYARTEDRRRAILAGFQAHLAKPVESGELLAIVASLAKRV